MFSNSNVIYVNHGRSYKGKSSLTRVSFHFVLFLLFMSFGYCSADIHFCHKRHREGHRLSGNSSRNVYAKSEIDCILLCVTDKCCRSINYRKTPVFDGKENCEILHEVNTELKDQDLKEDDRYDHLILLQPYRTFDCHCFQCTNGGTCDKNTKECKCQPGFAGKACGKVATSCDDWKQENGEMSSGVYSIDPDGQGAFNVSCDMTKDGRGWTVFQRRLDGSVDFYREWSDYKNGFGDLNGEFWLGLDKIHRLTKSGQNILRIDLKDFSNNIRYAKYSPFKVSNETNQYLMTVGSYSGNGGDSFSYHNGMKFSTKDVDNDKSVSSCAVLYKGAWWYKHCYDSNLNGFYARGGHTTSVIWKTWRGFYYSLKMTEMKLKSLR